MWNLIKDNRSCFIATFIFMAIGVFEVLTNFKLFKVLKEAFFNSRDLLYSFFIDNGIISYIVYFILKVFIGIPYYLMTLLSTYPFLIPIFAGVLLLMCCLYIKRDIGNIIIVFTIFASTFCLGVFAVELAPASEKYLAYLALEQEITREDFENSIKLIVCYWIFFYSTIWVFLALILNFNFTYQVDTSKENQKTNK